VIATLWPIGDRTAAALADDIYTALADPNTDPARALHTATRRLRDSHHGHNPALWAAHIHAGP
jgi:CHAT domain-containing protein